MLRATLTVLMAVSLAAAPAAVAKSPLIDLSVDLSVDLSGYDASCGVRVDPVPGGLNLRWPTDRDDWGHMSLDLEKGAPLIRRLALSAGEEAEREILLEKVDPVTIVTVGQRDLKKRNGWTIFFDKTHLRPHRTHVARLDPGAVRVTSAGRRATVSIDGASAGPFTGKLLLTLYAGSRLVHVELVLSSELDGQAILYDAGLTGSAESWERVAWLGTDDQFHRAAAASEPPGTEMAVRHRTIVAEGAKGSVAVFPPPHQYFYPLDFSDNLKFVWYGKGYRDLVGGFGLGVRQKLDGDRRFVPWFNAPPGTRQRLGVFYLLSRGSAEDAVREVKRYTRGDRFQKLPGHLTMTSHFHVEHTTDLVKRSGTDQPDKVRIPAELERPEFVEVFKKMGVDIAHLAEFHFGRTPKLNAAKRLPLLELMHRECERLSDGTFLLLPGEEPNVHFGGHWISLFPRPVYWVLNRGPGQPLVEPHPRYGTVYHVGSARDVQTLLERENGLAWTAHPRIKSSTGYPDRYRETDFFRSDRFLGGAWKAMPADLSVPRLGGRVLDLADDMANWGHRKYVLGEVDTFKIQRDHEQYAHMNINYLRLEKLPRFTAGWQPVLDALRSGRFFVTTGEILLSRFAVGGKLSGETLDVSATPQAKIDVDVEWTFPLAFAEVISGDGTDVVRRRVDLSDTRPFGQRTLRLDADLKGRSWVRFEVWDVAANGAFTPPVWLSR